MRFNTGSRQFRFVCVTRVGKVVALSGKTASVEFFDGRVSDSVDVSMVDADVSSFVEVYGNLALATLDRRDARERKKAWAEVRAALVRTRG